LNNPITKDGIEKAIKALKMAKLEALITL